MVSVVKSKGKVPHRRGEKVVIYIADQHIPYMDMRANELVRQVIKVLDPDELILGGDVVDFWQISKFCNNPLQRAYYDSPHNIQDDVDEVYSYLKDLRSLIRKNAQLIFLEGNHEDRLRIWTEKHPELTGLRAITPEEAFRIAEAGVTKYVPYRPRGWSSSPPEDEEHWVVPRKLVALHGHKYSANAGYVCNSMITEYGCSGLSSHNHKIGLSARQLRREQVCWWEVGCLCKIYPQYRQHANWQQGFAVVYVETTPPYNFFVENVQISPSYTCRVNGIKFNERGAL